MRWIITTDYMGGCLGLGENGEGIPAHAEVSQGHGLPWSPGYTMRLASFALKAGAATLTWTGGMASSR